MATRNGGNINFKINMQMNKNSLDQVLKPLKNIQDELKSMSADPLKEDFEEAAQAANKLESIINSSWNNKLGQLNLDKFNQSIKKSYGGVNQLKNSLLKAGDSGHSAFNAIAAQILNTNVQIKESNKLLDDMATSMANTIKWGITSSIFNNITGAIQRAYYYTKDLDTALNDIRIVTGDSAETMERFAKAANETSKSLGRSTLDYTKAALSFYQQGLSDEQVQARTEVTLKAQNITGVGSEMVDYLTSVWNGFGIAAEDAEGVVDKLAKVADSSASDMSELAIAMSKVASTANVMGVNVDQLTAQLATVIATTRQAPEAIGTAFKTIYTRLNDIKTGAEDAEISLGNYSGAMADLGFNVLDANGQLRDTGQVMEEIGSRWTSLTKEQQVYLAQTMGGLRQVNQVISLFENWETYSKLLNESLTAQGTLNQKNNVYLESMAAHFKELKAEIERTYKTLINPDAINMLTDGLNGALTAFNNYIEGIGSGINVFLNFGTIVAGIFSKQIAQGILSAEQSFQRFKANMNIFNSKESTIQAIRNKTKDNIAIDNASLGFSLDNKALQAQADAAQKTLLVQKGLTTQQQKQAVQLQRQIGLTTQKIINAEKEKKLADENVKILEKEYAAILLKNNGEKNNLEFLQRKQKLYQHDYHLNQKILINMEGMENSFNKILKSTSQADDFLNQFDKIYGDLWDNWMAIPENTEQSFTEAIDLIKKEIEDVKNGATGFSNDFYIIWDKLKGAVQTASDENKKTFQIINNYLKNMGIDTSNLTEEQKKRLVVLLQQNDALANQGKHVLNLQTLVKSLSITGQVLTAIGGSISAYFREGATAAEKANAAYSGATGAVSALLYAIPGIGPAISMISRAGFGILQTILKATGAFEAFEQQFKSVSDRVDELNEKIAKVNSQLLSDNKSIKSLKDIEEEWESLSVKAGQYGNNLKNLSKEEQDRYYQLINTFAAYNSDVIEGYNAQGQAIIANRGQLQQTIELLKEQRRLNVINTYGDLDTILSSENARLSQLYEKIAELEKTNQENALAFLDQVKDEIQNTITILLGEFDDLEQKEEVKGILGNTLEFLGFEGQGGLQGWLKQIAEDTNISNVQSYIEQFQTIKNNLFSLLNFSSNFDTKLSKLYGSKSHPDAQYRNGDNISFNTWMIDALSEEGSKQSVALQKAQEKYKDVQAEIAELQRQIQKTGQFNASLALNILQNYEEYYKTWEAVRTDENESALTQLVLEYLKSFIYDPNADGDTQAKVANSEEQLLKYGEQYIESIGEIFDTIDSQAKKAIKKADLDNFKGTTEEYENKIQEIIQEIINNLDQDLLKDKEKLEDIFSQLFNINIEIDNNNVVDNVSAKVEDSIRKVQNQINSILKNTYEYNHETFFTEQFLKSIFDFNKENVAGIIDSLDWGAFFKYLNSGEMNTWQALSQVVSNYRDKQKALISPYSQINSSLLLNQNEDFTNKLSKKQKLNDEEQAFLAFAESEYSKLAKIGTTVGRNNQQYISTLKQILPLMQTRYLNQLKTNEAINKGQLENQQAIINSTKNEDKLLQAKEKYITLLQQNARLNGEIQRTQNAIVTATKEEQIAAQDAILEDLEKRATIPSTIENAIKNLKDKSSISSDEAGVLMQLQQTNSRLRDIHEEQGIYSDNYVKALEQQLELQKNIADSVKQEQIAIYKNRIAEKEASIATLKNKNEINKITEDEYNSALKALNNEENLTNLQKENNQYIVSSYLQRIQNEENIKTLNQQILELQQKIFELNIKNPEEQAKSVLQLSKSFNELKQSLQNGKELTQQQQQSLSTVLDLVASRYPKLEWATSKLTKTWLAGTDLYKAALEEVSQALDRIVYEDLTQQTDQTLQKIKDLINKENGGLIEVDSRGFDAWVEEVQSFFDQDRELSIQVRTNAEEEFEKLSDELDNIYKTASKIGADYIVNADDLKDLSEVFPGILKGMTLLQDGTFQLNSQIAQQAITAAQGTINADSEAVKSQLQNQVTLFRTKAKIYRQIGAAARHLAEDEMATEEEAVGFKQMLSDNLSQVQRINSQLTVQAQKKDSKDLVKAAAKDIEIITENTVGGYDVIDARSQTSKANRISDSNEIVIASRNAANGQTTQIKTRENSQGDFQYKATLPGENDQNQIDTFEGLTGTALTGGPLTRQQYALLGGLAQDQAIFYDSIADELEDSIALITANTDRLNGGLANILSGKDIKGNDKKDKEKKQDHMDYLTDVADIYHTINERITKIGKDLALVESQQKKLTGQNLVNNLRTQYTLLERQVQAYKIKVQYAERERDLLRSSLGAQGVSFDSINGSIANYTEIINARRDAVNRMIAHYNSLSKEEQEAYKQTVDQAKKDYQQFKKDLDNYDKLVNETLPDLQKSIQDARDQQIELAIKNFKIKIDVALDLSQAERDWNKFKKTVINQIRDDDIIGNIGSKIEDFNSYYNVQGVSSIGMLTDHINKTIDQIHQIDATGTSSVYGDNRAGAIEDLKTYSNTLMNSLEDVEGIIKDIKQNFFDMIDKAQSAFDNQKKELDFIGKLIDHDKKVIQMVYGKEAYKMLDTFYKKQAENDIRALQNSREEKDFWWERIQHQKEHMEALDKNSNAYKEAEDRLKQLEDHWMSAIDNFNSNLENALDNLTESYKNKISEIFKQLDKQVTNGKGLENINEEWELIKDQSQMYLDPADTLHQVNKFANTYNKLSNSNANNLKAQKALRKVYEEQLEYLAKKDRLTKYDIERANQILEIQQKRLALQEARENKTALRLRRDSQGNYSYQYTSDQDELLKAVQELDDAQYKLYELDKDALQENLDKVYSAYSEFQQKLKALYEEYPVWTEEAQEKKQAIIRHYGTIINDLTTENAYIRQNTQNSTFDTIALGIERVNADSQTSSIYRQNLQNQTLNNLFNLYEEYSNRRNEALENNLDNYYNRQNGYHQNIRGLARGTLDHLLLLYEENGNAFDFMSQEMRNNIMNVIVPEWDSGVQHMVDVFVGNGGCIPTIEQGLNELQLATQDYRLGLDRLAEAGRIDYDALSQGIDDSIYKTQTLLQDTNQLFNTYRQQMAAVEGLIHSIDGLTDAYARARDAAIQAAEAARELLRANSINTIQTTPDILTPNDAGGGILSGGGGSIADIFNTGGGDLLSNGGGGGAGVASSGSLPIEYYSNPSPSSVVEILPNSPVVTDVVNGSQAGIQVNLPTPEQIKGIAGAIWFFKGAAGWGNDPFRADRLTNKWSAEGADLIQQYINVHGPNKDLVKEFYGKEDYLRNFFYQKLDTGGYTGSWNDSSNKGKFALLHEKELVLNKKDTENILQAVDFVRSMSENLKNHLLDSFINASSHIENLMQDLKTGARYGQNDDVNTQTVYITAEFPAVNTSKQIEMAFANLANQASQYIHSTRRTVRSVY